MPAASLPLSPPADAAAVSPPAPPRKSSRPVCAHCGVPVAAGETYCCGGCAFVAGLIRSEGLGAFYDLKAPVTAPATDALLPARDFAWLADAASAAEASAAPAGRAATLTLSLQGLSCAACGWLVEHLCRRRPGLGDVEVSAESGLLRLRWAPASGFDAPACARELHRFGYLAGPAGASPSSSEPGSRALARQAGLAAALAMNAMTAALPFYLGMSEDFEYARLFEHAGLLFASLSLVFCGSFFLVRAARALRARAAHLDLPIALGILGAYLGSTWGWAVADSSLQYFDFVAGFIALMLTGRWAQVAAVERNRRLLLREQPAAARVRVLRDGAWIEAAPESLVPGESFSLAPGALVPVEARLAGAPVEFSLSWITGEAEPRIFSPGQLVPAGATLLSGPASGVEFAATRAWAGSLLAELVAPVRRAPERARLIERVVQWYLVGILVSAASAGAWWTFVAQDLAAAGAVVVSILVVSCPCALGLAFPLAEEIVVVRLRRRGVFVRASDLWQRLRRIRVLVFDKTGTLTGDTPTLLNPSALDALPPDARAALLALVRHNPHPVGRSLHEAALLRGWPSEDALPGPVSEQTGHGVHLHPWSLVRASAADDAADTLLLRSGAIVARFSFAETPRPDASSELSALARRGLRLAVLSGDRDAKVSALASSLGLPLDVARGELAPREKAAWIDTHAPDSALMLGDGANDSLAFDHALCRGTPAIHRGVLAAKADFYYLGRGIGGVRALLEADDARRSTHAALLVFMIAYNLVAVGLAATGHMHPLLAAVLMPLSSLATLAIVWLGLRRTASAA